MVKGLAEVARRAAGAAARDEARRRAGGFIKNQATTLGDEARRYRLWVVWGAAAALTLIVLGLVLLLWLANRRPLDPREAAAQTQRYLTQYGALASQLKPTDGDKPTPEELKSRLTAALKKELATQEEGAAMQKRMRGAVDGRTREQIDFLRKSLEYRDGFGRQFVFELKDAQTLVVRSPSPGPGGSAPKSVTISLRSGEVLRELPPEAP